MFLELIGVIVAGLAGAGVMLILVRLFGGRFPKWAVPIGAGAAMLGTTISSEYSWYSRTAEALPEGFAVAQVVETTAVWRPWSYVFPVSERFSAVDLRNARENEAEAGLFLIDLYLFGRWSPVRSVQMMVDCPERRRADPAQGDASEPLWRDVPADDAIVAAVCGPAG